MTELDKETASQFKESWTIVELMYAEWILIHGADVLLPLYRLVFIWRRMGYDKKLRAGVSLNSLVLSRSKEHGLRPDQPWLRISVDQEKLRVDYIHAESKTSYTIDAPAADLVISDELQNLVDQLAAQPVS